MIFISGIHGVGKTFFCNLVKKEAGIETYSASALITQKKHAGFSKDKLISDIGSNQHYLLQAVDELKSSGHNFILDGHFCLLDKSAAGITRKFFFSYYAGKDKAVAYKLKDVVTYKVPKELSDYGISQAPQSFIYLD